MISFVLTSWIINEFKKYRPRTRLLRYMYQNWRGLWLYWFKNPYKKRRKIVIMCSQKKRLGEKDNLVYEL